MSSQGFLPARQDARGNEGNADGNGIRGPQRDAWDRPIVQPKEKVADPNVDDASIDDEAIDNLWSDIKKKPADNQQQPPNNQQQQPQNQQQQVDPKVQLQNYLKDNGLGEFVVSDAVKAEIKEGNFDNFNAQVLGLVQQAHVKALSGSQTLIKAEVAKAVRAAVDESKGFIAGKEAVSALNTALPFTKDPAIGPIAQTVMQRLLDRGATQEEAIKGVKLWSKKFVDLADPDRQVNGNRGGNFRGAPSNEVDTNWVSLLSPSSER